MVTKLKKFVTILLNRVEKQPATYLNQYFWFCQFQRNFIRKFNCYGFLIALLPFATNFTRANKIPIRKEKETTWQQQLNK
jgi:hypothetical protein